MLTSVELRVEEVWTVVTSMILLFTSSLAFRDQEERRKASLFISDSTDSEMADTSVLWETTIILNLIE